jgi:hypothetical protein
LNNREVLVQTTKVLAARLNGRKKGWLNTKAWAKEPVHLKPLIGGYKNMMTRRKLRLINFWIPVRPLCRNFLVITINRMYRDRILSLSVSAQMNQTTDKVLQFRKSSGHQCHIFQHEDKSNLIQAVDALAGCLPTYSCVEPGGENYCTKKRTHRSREVKPQCNNPLLGST